MNDRIKLCEAMGDAIRWRNGYPFRSGSTVEFDPLEDANDDYAVLEWLRSDNDRADAAFEALENMKHCPLPSEFSINYEIGDYARAALKVLDQSNGGAR